MEPQALKDTLSIKEKQFYADNGYLVIRGLFDNTACDNTRKRFRQLVNREVPRGKVAMIEDFSLKQKSNDPEDYVNKINMLSFDPEFMKYTEYPKLLDILSQLLSDKMTIMNSMLINKPPGSPWHPPHQTRKKQNVMEPQALKNYTLSIKEKQFYADNGYLVIRGLFDNTACDNMRKRFRQLVNREVPRGKVAMIEDFSLKQNSNNPEDYVNKINMLSFDPEFMKYTEYPKLLDILSQLLSDKMTIMNSMLINKPPGSPWHPPHQDMYHLPLRPNDKVLTTWTAIDEATEENGCLYVIPGSHKENVIYEENILPGFVNSLYFTITDLETSAPKDKWIALPMKPGDTVFINSMLVHGSYPNTSKKYRKAITNIYASDECEYIDVAGTVQEPFMTASLKELGSRGVNVKELGYIDIWKSRTKKIQKSRD